MTFSVRRSLVTLALGAALATSGCAGVGTTDVAAFVDGQPIREKAVQAAVQEINDHAVFQGPIAATDALTVLIQAPVIFDYSSSKGIVASESAARAELSAKGLTEPSESTITIYRFVQTIAGYEAAGGMGEADQAAMVQNLASLDVTANPRYGTYDPAQASIQAISPEWIEPVGAAPAP